MILFAPVPLRAYISQRFGENPYRYGYGPRGHMGIDFGGVGVGTLVYAALPGLATVRDFGTGAYGLSVWIDCGPWREGEVVLIYGHLSRVFYSERDVRSGDVLGLTGDTGNCDGAHLHFEVRVNGQQMDPEPWMQDAWEYRG